MKFSWILLAVALVLTVSTASTLKSKDQKVYAFGIAASFNDSVVYYTEIQQLDSVELDKNGFLPRRDLYSEQFRNHLEYEMSKPNYTCMIYFSANKAKLEKEAAKVKGKYKKGQMVIQSIDPKAFTFKKPEE